MEKLLKVVRRCVKIVTGTESWTPSSSVFVSEMKVTIKDMIVCVYEVTRGEFEAVMEADLSTASD